MNRKKRLEELERMDVASFKTKQKTPINIVLDNIRSALNVGSIFRTSDAFALQHVYLCGITARPPHKEILKTAIGATEAVDWSYHESTLELIQTLKESSTICSIEQTTDSVLLHEFQHDFQQKDLTLVFGNEVYGVDEQIIQESDYCIEIPQFGTKHSLNVAVCAGMTIWECWKKQ